MDLSVLQQWMRENGVDCAYFTCFDPHQSESAAAHWKAVQWVTGFTGSMGYAFLTQEEAAFWTDGRYLDQARREVNPGFQVYSISVPTDPEWPDWVKARVPEGGRLALDGSVLSIASFRGMNAKLSEKKIRMELDLSGLLGFWEGRPAIPSDPVYELEPQYLCHGRPEKLARVREGLPRNAPGGGYYLANCLDDVLWLTNLRGLDNPLYPFYHGYVLLSADKAWLCTHLDKIPEALQEELRADGFTLLPYEEITRLVASLPPGAAIRLDPYKTSAGLFWTVPEGVRIDELPELITLIKAHKSPEEQANVRDANLRESAAVVRLMMWIEENVGRIPMDEYQVGQKLQQLRELDPLFLQPANIPIVGYGPNAALPHYRPSARSALAVEPKGFLLFDVCAQYKTGTTDLCRTVAVGEITDEMRRDYTTVLKAHIKLACQKFPAGTTGNLLDAVIKSDHWNLLTNFFHGTGHGIGYVSNIHEGPGKICLEYAAPFPYAFQSPLEEGMLFSNEPGLYKPGRFGVRIENSVFVQPFAENEFGKFYCFETLTFLPFENKAIVREMLTEKETEWIRAYYRDARAKLAAFLDEGEREWLRLHTEF